MSEYRKKPKTQTPTNIQSDISKYLLNEDKRKNTFIEIYKELKTLSNLLNEENYNKALARVQELYEIIVLKYEDASVKSNLLDLCFEYEFYSIICKLVEKGFSELTLFLKNTRDSESPERCQVLVTNCDSLIRTFNEYSQLSTRFIREAYEKDILKHLFVFFQNQKIFEWLNDPSELLKEASSELISLLIDALVNLCRLSSSYKGKWDAVEAVKTLIKISEISTIKNNFYLNLCIVLANVATENEIKNLKEMNSVIKEITEMIGQIAEDMKSATQQRRIRINLEKDSNESHEIAVIRTKTGFLFQFVELADALYHMVSKCNDTMKYETYERARGYLREIINKGNKVEQERAFAILEKMCHNEQVLKHVLRDLELVAKSSELGNNTNHVKEKLAPENLANMIEKIAGQIQVRGNENRVRIKLEENSNEWHEVAAIRVSENGVEFNFVELANALYHMACNDTIKYEIYKTYNMKSHLADIIEHGNEVEREYAFKILEQLCFDDRVATDVLKNEILCERIRQLASKTSEETTRQGLITICKDINFQLNQMSSVHKTGQHVMISYNHGTKELCRRIQGEVVKMGYKVWIDEDDMRDSCLEAMARAIENSMCVLLCITEQYKNSKLCRYEAEYVVQCSKPFVPIIMQPNYRPNGWLGILLGQKLYIDFTKSEFKECINKLSLEIRYALTSHGLRSGSGASAMSAAESNRRIIMGWTPDQVKQWFNGKSISAAVRNAIDPCSGKFLHQLYTIESKAPEFFYKSIFSEATVKDVIFFVIELKQLFG